MNDNRIQDKYDDILNATAEPYSTAILDSVTPEQIRAMVDLLLECKNQDVNRPASAVATHRLRMLKTFYPVMF